MAQSPAFNTEAKSGQVITVTVSDGRRPFACPRSSVRPATRREPELTRLHLDGARVRRTRWSRVPRCRSVAIARVVNAAGKSISTAAVHSTVVLERSTGPDGVDHDHDARDGDHDDRRESRPWSRYRTSSA